MPDLQHKRILLGITGGVAAYKAAELTRLLVKAGADVRVVMSTAATQFVTPLTFQALSGKPVLTQLWETGVDNGMAHIEFTRAVDAVLIAPASADFIAKLVHGLADDLLSTLCLARACPLLVAPAMNRQMWENPATQRNIHQLQADGVTLLGPTAGEQACGETGPGRMLEPAELLAGLSAYFQPKLLAGLRVLVSAGPTLEMIDPVRALTNLSSGKMGYAVARAAYEAGATVTLVSGPTCREAPLGVTRLSVTSTEEMGQALMNTAGLADIFISVAAVADYRPAICATQKIKKSEQTLTLDLIPNDDILLQIANRADAPFCVGFAAETENLPENGEAKRHRKNLPLLVVNRAQDALGSDDNELLLLDDEGKHLLPHADKLTLARQLIAHIARLYLHKTKGSHATPN
ncbi:phosphopantothenoylcysteine decarboxylase [Sulfuriferula multivorans]|uniref:Coenzyme A biosynthesis bifunctional protein CoaBC n=1 Tax=Sulfuriferula multivorans TaxID=1559896 RepID=A0A401JBD2_9PROT|nr:bifunctional phosphopantothenoylcysteine decarboxylase/phosphopantothenate--cysteine ligase CoaBC [Sulfuriferula multivorans]GBL44927.1 phosphopantothenoylcysteine decarboxylase [Sulfuriferula multivorans]